MQLQHHLKSGLRLRGTILAETIKVWLWTELCTRVRHSQPRFWGAEGCRQLRVQPLSQLQQPSAWLLSATNQSSKGSNSRSSAWHREWAHPHPLPSDSLQWAAEELPLRNLRPPPIPEHSIKLKLNFEERYCFHSLPGHSHWLWLLGHRRQLLCATARRCFAVQPKWWATNCPKEESLFVDVSWLHMIWAAPANAAHNIERQLPNVLQTARRALHRQVPRHDWMYLCHACI